jgi:hypothetical protein
MKFSIFIVMVELSGIEIFLCIEVEKFGISRDRNDGFFFTGPDFERPVNSSILFKRHQ